MKRFTQTQTEKLSKKAGVSRRLFTLLFCVIVLFCGCGSNLPEAPELLEPAKGGVSFRPVSKRVVGYVRVLYGNVVGTEYPCYSDKGAQITSMKVAIGDYVNEGDVLAVSDKDGLAEELRQINFRIESLQREREKTIKVYDQTFGLLNYKKDTEVYLEGNELAQLLKEEQMQQENLRYELSVIDTQIRQEKDLINTRKEKMKTIEFKAPHSGYVTYVCDLSEGNYVAAFENVAVISDAHDLYVEVPDVNIEKYNFGEYQSKWTEIDGKKVPIEEYDYDLVESAYASATHKNPFMRFRVPGAELELGANIALYFLDDTNEERLAVGNDSLYRDGMDAFVYVKKDDAGNTEKRMVETGVGDEYYTEIKSGLEEGEMVLYGSNEYYPSNYEEYEVVSRTYTEEVYLNSVSMAYPYYDIYLAGHDGRLNRSEGSVSVEKGEKIFSISFTGGNADVEAAAVAIDDLNTNHQVYLKEYEKAKKELDRALASLQETERMIGAKSDMGPDSEEIDMIRSGMNAEAEIRAQLNTLEIEKEYEQKEYEATKEKLSKDYQTVKTDRGGSHELVATARDDGKMAAFPLATDEPVNKGQFIVSLLKKMPAGSNSRLFLSQSFVDGNDPPANVGTEVVFKTSDDREFTGRCVGKNPDDGKYYLFSENGKATITTSTPYKKPMHNQFYVQMDDVIDENWIPKSELRYNAYCFPNVITVPAVSVHVEANKLSSKDRVFVWKLIDGQPVKEYVTIFESDRPKQSVLILQGVSKGDIVLQ